MMLTGRVIVGDEARRWNPAYWWNGVSVCGFECFLFFFLYSKNCY